LHPAGDTYNFRFGGTSGSKIFGTVQFITNWRGYVDFIDSDVRLNFPIPQDVVDASRPVMRRIELALSQQCAVAKLAMTKEWCHGVDCKPIAD